jgi:hypothetical protein
MVNQVHTNSVDCYKQEIPSCDVKKQKIQKNNQETEGCAKAKDAFAKFSKSQESTDSPHDIGSPANWSSTYSAVPWDQIAKDFDLPQDRTTWKLYRKETTLKTPEEPKEQAPANPRADQNKKEVHPVNRQRRMSF